MPRLVVVSDSPALASGLGRVVRELVPRFQQRGWTVDVAGWFHAVAPATRGPFPYRISTSVLKDRQETLAPVLLECKPDAVLCIGDPWDFTWVAKAASQSPFRLIGYLTIEGEPVPPSWEPTLDAFDAIATSSEYGARVMNATGPWRAVPVHYGVNRAVFRPLPTQDRLRLSSGRTPEFLVLLNAQNTVRKNLGTAIRGFGRFAETRPDVHLYANTQLVVPENMPQGVQLMDTIMEVNLDDRVSFRLENRGPFTTDSDTDLNRFYNLGACLLVSSMAEGFGLPVLEAMAIGVVPVAPAAYSMPELLAEERGILYPIAATIPGSEQRMVAVSESAIRDGLAEFYEMPEATRQGYRQRAYAFALAHPWERTFEELYPLVEGGKRPRAAIGTAVNLLLRRRVRRVIRESEGEAVDVRQLTMRR